MWRAHTHLQGLVCDGLHFRVDHRRVLCVRVSRQSPGETQDARLQERRETNRLQTFFWNIVSSNVFLNVTTCFGTFWEYSKVTFPQCLKNETIECSLQITHGNKHREEHEEEQGVLGENRVADLEEAVERFTIATSTNALRFRWNTAAHLRVLWILKLSHKSSLLVWEWSLLLLEGGCWGGFGIGVNLSGSWGSWGHL